MEDDMSLDVEPRESLSPDSRRRKTKELFEKSWVDMFADEEDNLQDETLEEGELEKTIEKKKTTKAIKVQEEIYTVVDETGDFDDPDILVLDETSKDNSGEGRTIAIDFIERRNEEKFEKLVKEEKIKTPFKRRLSGDSDHEEEKNGTESKRMKDSERTRTASSSSGSTNNSSKPKKEYEKDPEILNRRQKQIDFGKNTIGYDNYINQVPKEERKTTDPRTPQKNIKYSRRAWDGLIKQWRKQLHAFDTNSGDCADSDTKEA
ncbi:Histone RNA hairpin-binding protein [Sergentomyia squamirostris]